MTLPNIISFKQKMMENLMVCKEVIMCEGVVLHCTWEVGIFCQVAKLKSDIRKLKNKMKGYCVPQKYMYKSCKIMQIKCRCLNKLFCVAR